MKIDISSQDVDLLIMAQAVLGFVRETYNPDAEYAKRLAAAEDVLHRLAHDAMMDSPIVQAAFAKGDPIV